MSAHLSLVTIVVEDYGPAIEFFVGILGFELVEDSPALTNDGRPKRWVVVRPPGAETGVLLARADGELWAATPVGLVAFAVSVPLHQRYQSARRARAHQRDLFEHPA